MSSDTRDNEAETSRVLGSAPNTERQPLLSPDDPGVSPLNVSNVHYAKIILNTVSFLSTIWFIFMLLSDFVSVPGLNNRGRSFLEINWLLISLFSTLSTLVFFKVPSELERILGYATSGLVLFDLLLLLIFQSSDIGFVGFISCFWALSSIVFTSVSEYLVEQGKIHEEIRLTGRVETRRTLGEWVIVLLRNTLKIILLVYTLLLSWNILLHTFDILRVKPWGDKVDVEEGSFGLHLYCQGDVFSNSSSSTQPILLLESGHNSDEDFSEWIQELYHLNKIDRYCIYDRPGYGFSDSSPSPVSLSIVSDLLKEALDQKDIHGPFSLVSFDIGGLYSQVFASRYLEQVSSLLFVDSWHEDLLLRNPTSRSKRDEPLPKGIASMNSRAGFKLWIEGLLSPLGLPLQSSWLIKHRGSKSRIYGRDMVYQGKYIRARLQEQISASILSYHEVLSSRSLLKNIPISVASSDFMVRDSLNWGDWQRQLTKISSQTVEWKIIDGGHECWKTPKGKDQLQDVLLRLLEK